MSNITRITTKPVNFRRKTGVKSLVITALTCTVQGSSYFSAEVVVNGTYVVTLRFQQGYGEIAAYEAAVTALYDLGMIDFSEARWGEYDARKIRHHFTSHQVHTVGECRRFGRGGV